MPRFLVRLLLLLSLAAIAPSFYRSPGAAAPTTAAKPQVSTERTVFLLGELAEEDLIAFTSGLAAAGHQGVLLLDTPPHSKNTEAFLTNYGPDKIVPLGKFAGGQAAVETRLGRRVQAPIECKHGLTPAVWKLLFPQAERVVVCPAEPRRQLLQAACLAGALKAPLLVTHAGRDDTARLQRRFADWHTKEVYAVGKARIGPQAGKVKVRRLADEADVADAYLKRQAKQGPVQAFVVANPSDSRRGLAPMSPLAPWLALERRGVLLLTNDEGDNTSALVRQALKQTPLRAVDTLLLAAELRAIPVERRLNPVEGKDTHIEMEPLTPSGTEPYSFATGRLFHPEPGVVTLMLARQRLLLERPPAGPRKALVVSNPSGGLPLLEVFSRHTAKELANCGHQTTAIFGDDVTKSDVRRLLPEHDLWLWEGHHSTLIKDYQMPEWTEPLPSTFVFLQSCLALAEPKAQPLLQRGAVAVVGSSTRTYSATGGAFSLAYFNAMLYDDLPAGASLRQAKNFLLAYSLLKEKRLGQDARLGGANHRSAWAFTLWGDPTLKLPRSPVTEARPGVRHEVRGNSIIVHLPDTPHDKVVNGDFRALMRPNARLAGLIRRDDDGKRLVPFVFAEVRLPKAPPHHVPRLSSRLPEDNWVFCWDERRRCGYLLVTPRPRDERELRFRVDWHNPTVEARATP